MIPDAVVPSPHLTELPKVVEPETVKFSKTFKFLETSTLAKLASTASNRPCNTVLSVTFKFLETFKSCEISTLAKLASTASNRPCNTVFSKTFKSCKTFKSLETSTLTKLASRASNRPCNTVFSKTFKFCKTFKFLETSKLAKLASVASTVCNVVFPVSTDNVFCIVTSLKLASKSLFNKVLIELSIVTI